MKINRLSWAGLLLESPSTTLYIDPLQHVANLAPFLGPPKLPVLPIPAPRTETVAALITHVHPDHFDQPYLQELLKNVGALWGPEPVHGAARAMGLAAHCSAPYETFAVGDFRITAVPAVDWIGDEQVSYVVSDGQHTILHGGDTNWHGYWWNIAQRFGPLDVAFLPVNGVVGAVPGVNPPSDMFGTMTPAQAVTATRLLGAPTLVPLHYAQFDNPPLYQQFPAIEFALDEAGNQQRVAIRRLKDGETIDL